MAVGEDNLMERSWQNLPAWMVSLGVHIFILTMLASITYVVQPESTELLVTSMKELFTEQDVYTVDTKISQDVGSEMDFNRPENSLAAAANEDENPVEMIEEQIQEDLVNVTVPETSVMSIPSELDLTEAVEVVGQTEHTGGVEGAIDRLTLEIAAKLNERPTLVVWLFDASGSLAERREMIMNRFRNVYHQLGVLEKRENELSPLESAVVSYGNDLNYHTDNPVKDVPTLIKAVQSIKEDKTGKEYVFNAVNKVSKRWQSYRTKMRHNMMIIVVTDEKGDDIQMLDQTIAFNKRYGIPVYCVGNAAVFGRAKGYVSYSWKEGNNSFTRDLPVDQGPETVYAERVNLPFWNVNNRSLENISASYGPYGLTRLCAETGGLYLISEENDGPTFDYTVMRSYSPDYRPVKMIDIDIRKNMAKQSLLMAAKVSFDTDVPVPAKTFRADTDNRLRQELTEAQKPLAVLDYHINETLSILERGESDRDQLSEPRWRAAFDLAYGRALAMRARALGYNAMCADMKAAPKKFEKETNNHWQLVPSEEITSGASVRKLAQKAQESLQRVIDEHPGTPWALLASQELEDPLGWQWREIYIMTPEERAEKAKDDPKLLLAEEERKERMRRASIQPKNVPKL